MPTFFVASVLLGLRRIFFAFFSSFLILSLHACDGNPFTSAADLKAATKQALEAKNFSEAASLARRWSEKINTDYEPQFLLAQASAQIGDKNGAIAALERAIKLGLKDDEQIDQCVNLTPIKSMAAYQDLMSSNFPSRTKTEISQSGTVSGNVNIQTGGDKQTVRAGDVVIEIPSVK